MTIGLAVGDRHFHAPALHHHGIIVGIVGALLGGFIMGLFGHAGVTGWNWRSFGVAVLGAVVLLFILRLIRGRGRVRGRG